MLAFLWPHKSRLMAAGAALIFTAGAQLTLGYGVRILIDEGFSGADATGLYKAVSFILIIGGRNGVWLYDAVLSGVLVGRACER